MSRTVIWEPPNPAVPYARPRRYGWIRAAGRFFGDYGMWSWWRKVRILWVAGVYTIAVSDEWASILSAIFPGAQELLAIEIPSWGVVAAFVAFTVYRIGKYRNPAYHRESAP